ncbi:hypothetical protein DL98DRAFT_594139 [Cadophora sp. DSE1049]|nr:hypothetical protein DL98DRAFT_594139 [Cadophora sp. DSE1049]
MFALPESCAIAIYQNGGDYVKTGTPDVYTMKAFGKRPVHLRVTHESRQVALKYYKLSFGAVDGKPKYFDFNFDALHLWGVDPDFLDKMPYIKDDLAKVQNLAIHGTSLIADKDHFARLRHFTSLKKLLVEKPYYKYDSSEKDKFYKMIELAASELVTQNTAKPVQAATSVAAESKGGNQDVVTSANNPLEDSVMEDVDVQTDHAVETGSAMKGASTEETQVHGTTAPNGVVKAMPEVGTMIDQALADMSVDVDMMIDEDMADISSVDAIHVQPANTIKELVITELILNFQTMTYTSSVTKVPVKETDVTMADEEGGGSLTATGSAMEIDSPEQAVVKAPAAIVDHVSYFGSLVVVYKTSEDILEVVMNPSQWPERIDKENKHWKWTKDKPRDRSLWLTGPHSLVFDYDYPNTAPVDLQVPAPPLANPLAQPAIVRPAPIRPEKALPQAPPKAPANKSSSETPRQASAHIMPPASPMQVAVKDSLPVISPESAERKGAVDAILANPLGPNPFSPRHDSAKLMATIDALVANPLPINPYSLRQASVNTISEASLIQVSANKSLPTKSPASAELEAADDTIIVKPLPLKPYNSGYPNSGYTGSPRQYASAYGATGFGNTAGRPFEYISPYLPSTTNAVGAKFGILRFATAGAAGSVGGSSAGGPTMSAGPIAGPIPLPRYTEVAKNKGGGAAYQVRTSRPIPFPRYPEIAKNKKSKVGGAASQVRTSKKETTKARAKTGTKSGGGKAKGTTPSTGSTGCRPVVRGVDDGFFKRSFIPEPSSEEVADEDVADEDVADEYVAEYVADEDIADEDSLVSDAETVDNEIY